MNNFIGLAHSALDYRAGVSFEEWEADDAAPECQLCHRCDLMFLRSLVTECEQCYDAICSACSEGHADEHKPNALHELPPPCGSECNQDATGG